MIARYAGQELNAGGREGLAGVAPSYQRQVQVAPILRAAAPKIFARTNGFWTVNFSFAKEYDTLVEAHEEATKFCEELPDSGDLELEETGDSAAVQSTIYEGAVFQGAVPTQLGKTFVISLSFVARNRKVTPAP